MRRHAAEITRETWLSVAGAGLFMLSLGALDVFTRGAIGLPALVPPFGASALIVFFAPQSPAARPWNIIVGHLGAAFIATSVLTWLPDLPIGMQAALAVAGAGVWMLVTASVHPPGGATALLAVVAEHRLGFGMLLCPMLAGCLNLVGIRLLLDGIGQLLGAMSSAGRAAASAERLQSSR